MDANSGLHKSDQLRDYRAKLVVIQVRALHQLVVGTSMLARLLIESFSLLAEVAGLLWVSGHGAGGSHSLWKLLQGEIKMLLIGLSIARELCVALVAIIMLFGDL